MTDNSTEDDELLKRATGGSQVAFEDLFGRCRDRLRRMVEIRLDIRLRGRIDPSDVLQDAFFEASQRAEEYLRNRPMPVFLWLRFLVAQRLAGLHRHHLGVQARDASREVSLFSGLLPAACSTALAERLLGSFTSPSAAVVRSERALRLQDAVNSMDPIDREVLSLRHFEQLSRFETAQVLGITESAAGKRYLRALQRLKKLLAELDDLTEA